MPLYLAYALLNKRPVPLHKNMPIVLTAHRSPIVTTQILYMISMMFSNQALCEMNRTLSEIGFRHNTNACPAVRWK